MIVLDANDLRWTAFVEHSSAATAFHHPRWSALLAATYGFRASALAEPAPDGSLVAGLPVIEVPTPLRGRRWVTLPFTDTCQPLAGPGYASADFASDLDRTRRAAGITRLDVHAEIPGAEAHRRSAAVIHRLALDTDADVVFRRFHASQVRRNIRRAEREDLELRRAETRQDLTEVFYGLHLRTRRRQGVPVQPRRFFERLWDMVLAPGFGFVSLAYAGGRPVAGAVFLTWNRTVIYKYGASDADAWPARPNHLIFWDAIRWACANGFHTFDFGRTDVDNEGLRRFKSGWGAHEAVLTYSTLADKGPRSSNHRAAALLQPVLRRTPAWVCRVTGELLYKYAGT